MNIEQMNKEYWFMKSVATVQSSSKMLNSEWDDEVCYAMPIVLWELIIFSPLARQPGSKNYL